MGTIGRELRLGMAVLLAGIACAGPALASRGAVRVPSAGAELFSSSRQCYAKVVEGPQATLRARLYGGERLIAEARGVREMAWIGEALVFAASPASGKPGIYVWDCGSVAVRRVVGPLRSSIAHPGGTDFYQLVEIDGEVLYYEHAPDVDSPTLEQDLARGIETLRLRAARPRVSTR
jgi:hypothetical protein